MSDPVEHQLVEMVGDPDAPALAKAKRKKGTSPTARTLAECRKRGWIAGVVEQFVRFPPPGHKVDLFGVIDIVAVVPPEPDYDCLDVDGNTRMRPGAILAIQATAGAGGAHAARRAKILAEPRARQWVDAGARLELWSWALQGDRGKAKRWKLRVETYQEMLASSNSC